MAASGYTEADFEGANPIWPMVGGFVVPAVIAFGIGLVIKWRGASTLATCATTGLLLGIFLGAGQLGYALVYSLEHSTTLFALNGLYAVITHTLGGAVFAVFKNV